jgi:hypothetical protein
MHNPLLDYNTGPKCELLNANLIEQKSVFHNYLLHHRVL